MKYEIKKFYRKNKKNVHTAGWIAGAVVLYKVAGFMIIPGFIIGWVIHQWRKR